jgi:hypothetical protein
MKECAFSAYYFTLPEADKTLIPRPLRQIVIPAKAGIQRLKLDAGSGPA